MVHGLIQQQYSNYLIYKQSGFHCQSVSLDIKNSDKDLVGVELS